MPTVKPGAISEVLGRAPVGRLCPGWLRSPRAPSRAQSGTHPTLYQCLDEQIKLSECEVYSYTPDMEFDPHANDSDEEDEVASADEDVPSSDDDTQFQFDDYTNAVHWCHWHA